MVAVHFSCHFARVFLGRCMPSKIIHSAPSRAQITLHSVGLSLGGKQLLQDVDLSVTPTSRLGIVGENGRGKTTLLHVLAGRLTPDAGTVTRHGSFAVAEQEMPAKDGRTVGDAIAETITPAVSALAELDATSAALAEGRPQAEERFAQALEYAQAIEAW